jgi:hypothetical protein
MAANDTTTTTDPVSTTDASQTVTTDTTTVAPVTGPSPDGSSTGVTADDASPVTVSQSIGTAPAQVQGPTPAPQSTVPVHETHVKADTVITDTSSPLAVQVPVEAQGDALTPIGRAYADARTPEDVFAAAPAE